MIAANEGKTEFVKVLLSKGAVVNAKNQKGATALSYAKAGNFRETIILLEKAGAIGLEIDKAQIPQRIGPIDVLPKRIYTPESRVRYTDEARMMKISGVVRFRILVAADGSVKKAKLISGLPYGLTEQAIQAVKKIKVEPGSHEGKPVDYWLPVQYSFTIY
jgi:TonB family protein